MLHPTSHFIGIPIHWTWFQSLFASIKILLWNDQDCIQFQDFNSIHITLYYLTKNINNEDLEFIQNYLHTKKQWWSIMIESFGVFSKSNSPYVYFFHPKVSINIHAIHNDLKEWLPSMWKVYENTLEFIPHITLFKIVDVYRFKQYQSHIESIIGEYMTNDSIYIFESIYLYSVDSLQMPEKQIIII